MQCLGWGLWLDCGISEDTLIFLCARLRFRKMTTAGLLTEQDEGRSEVALLPWHQRSNVTMPAADTHLSVTEHGNMAPLCVFRRQARPGSRQTAGERDEKDPARVGGGTESYADPASPSATFAGELTDLIGSGTSILALQVVLRVFLFVNLRYREATHVWHIYNLVRG